MISWRLRQDYQNSSMLCCVNGLQKDTHTYVAWVKISFLCVIFRFIIFLCFSAVQIILLWCWVLFLQYKPTRKNVCEMFVASGTQNLTSINYR